MSGSPSQHWDAVFAGKEPADTSWYQPDPVMSLRLLATDGRLPESVIDVGGGEAVLADRLLAAGAADVTVLDVSAEALARVRARHPDSSRLHTVTADVTSWLPDRQWDAWHDRAVLHFLTDDGDRAAYVEAAAGAVVPGGLVVIGVFAADGPEACSGLPVVRYSAEDLVSLFDAHFASVQTTDEWHVTPWGARQHFVWAVLRRR